MSAEELDELAGMLLLLTPEKRAYVYVMLVIFLTENISGQV